MWIAVVITLMLGCAGPNPRDASLYAALGEQAGIERIVESLLDRVHTDPRIAEIFDENNREFLHDRIVELICFEAGGPCEYTGLEMPDAHAGLQIRHAEFDAFVEDLILAMEENDIDTRAQNGLLAIFAPLREDIVDH